MQLSGVRLLFAAALLSAGCGESGPPAVPCEVQEVLQAKCLRCHGEVVQFGAPYQFLTLEQIREVRGDKPVYDRMLLAVETEFMPPLQLETTPAVEPLTPAEKSVLLDWVRAGAPGESDGDCAGD
jgi:hypothetical protein